MLRKLSFKFCGSRVCYLALGYNIPVTLERIPCTINNRSRYGISNSSQSRGNNSCTSFTHENAVLLRQDKRPRISFQMKCYSSRCNDDSSSAICNGQPGRWPDNNPANFHFHPETESIMNEQLGAEMKAFYYYLSMAGYFGRVDVALPGCELFFMQMHHEEHSHVLRFFDYIKMRGGSVKLCPILEPDDQDWKCPLNAFKVALQLEMEVADKLVDVNRVAEKHNDLNASDFIVTGFMEEQMKSISELAKLVTVLSGIGDRDLARFIFDRDLLKQRVTLDPDFKCGKKGAKSK